MKLLNTKENSTSVQKLGGLITLILLTLAFLMWLALVMYLRSSTNPAMIDSQAQPTHTNAEVQDHPGSTNLLGKQLSHPFNHSSASGIVAAFERDGNLSQIYDQAIALDTAEGSYYAYLVISECSIFVANQTGEMQNQMVDSKHKARFDGCERLTDATHIRAAFNLRKLAIDGGFGPAVLESMLERFRAGFVDDVLASTVLWRDSRDYRVLEPLRAIYIQAEGDASLAFEPGTTSVEVDIAWELVWCDLGRACDENAARWKERCAALAATVKANCDAPNVHAWAVREAGVDATLAAYAKRAAIHDWLARRDYVQLGWLQSTKPAR